MHITPEQFGHYAGTIVAMLVSGVSAYQAIRAKKHVKEARKEVSALDTRVSNVEQCFYPACGHVCDSTGRNGKAVEWTA